MGIPARPINVIIIGTDGDRGICVVEELVYTYVIWISPSYNLQVIRSHDALNQGKYLTTHHFYEVY
ncbi:MULTISPECIES: hypothetical protein [Commensalibacter]|uniref:KilA-N domain-containing protein n=1 Tax=Commensalibacter papalotli (ex Servin-Garciduenas et al. 2014) TaxID=1208583 RepID=W7DU57_9PROT|nr:MULTISPECIES: hypothetical protein [Commensalibacter]EUK18565.1 hypothetical protein COMX_02415 [Commensalibacter papalotli (ex Servin-Garciduenas et al. 2014)]